MGHPPDPVVACGHRHRVRLCWHEGLCAALHMLDAMKALYWLHGVQKSAKGPTP